jgi:hypothetical protein
LLLLMARSCAGSSTTRAQQDSTGSQVRTMPAATLIGSLTPIHTSRTNPYVKDGMPNTSWHCQIQCQDVFGIPSLTYAKYILAYVEPH